MVHQEKTSSSPRVLVVEDEPTSRALVVAHLRAAGFEVDEAESGEEMQRALSSKDVDLVLLDVDLPGESGFRLAADLRRESDVAVVFLTRLGDVAERLRGLAIGDDYVTKPADMRELVARIRAVLRRTGARETANAAAARSDLSAPFGGFRLDLARHALQTPDGEHVPLSRGELAIVRALVEARGAVVRRDVLLQLLRGDGAGTTSGVLDVLVHRIRGKLGEGRAVVPTILVTVHGVGYRIATSADGD